MTSNSTHSKTLTRIGKMTTTRADGTVEKSGPATVIQHADRVQINGTEHPLDECKIEARAVTVGITRIEW